MHAGAGSKHWYTLMRRDAGDAVSGRLQLGYAWDVTARSLLGLKLAALENVLSQRQEILCALNPVPAHVAHRWTLESTKPDKAGGQVGHLLIVLSMTFYYFSLRKVPDDCLPSTICAYTLSGFAGLKCV